MMKLLSATDYARVARDHAATDEATAALARVLAVEADSLGADMLTMLEHAERVDLLRERARQTRALIARWDEVARTGA